MGIAAESVIVANLLTIHHTSNFLAYFNGRHDIANVIINDMERYEVRKPDKSVIAACYDAKKFAKWGICETFEARPYNWGFCSRSCRFKDDVETYPPYHPYEETKMLIMNRAPRGSQLSTCNATFC